MPHYFLLLALIKPTTETGHCLSPVSALYHILDRRIVTGGLSHWAAVQLLGEIRQVTCPSLVADQDKRHRSTPCVRQQYELCEAAPSIRHPLFGNTLSDWCLRSATYATGHGIETKNAAGQRADANPT